MDAAVESGRAELSALASAVDGVADRFQEVFGEVGGELAEIIEGFTIRTRRHLDDEWAAFDTFNIAFFGRTGTGKSTLLSAFGELDGESVIAE